MTSPAKTSAVAWLGLLAVFVLALAACGGDSDDGAAGNGGASPVGYLEALAPALQAVNARLDGLDELRAAAFDNGPDADAADAYGAAYGTFASERLAAIEALTPDESLADEHQALVSAADDGVLFAEELRARLSESPPANEAEYLALLGSLDGATIASRYRDACTALQVSATAGGLDLDLQCLL